MRIQSKSPGDRDSLGKNPAKFGVGARGKQIHK
jgi:hypothetical protein